MSLYVNHRSVLTQPAKHIKAIKTYITYVMMILKHNFPHSARIQAAADFITGNLKSRTLEKTTFDSYMNMTITLEAARKASFLCLRCGSNSRPDEARVHLMACLQMEIECQVCKGWFTSTKKGCPGHHKCH